MLLSFFTLIMLLGIPPTGILWTSSYVDQVFHCLFARKLGLRERLAAGFPNCSLQTDLRKAAVSACPVNGSFLRLLNKYGTIMSKT